MDKIREEINISSNPWIKRIGNYLLSREDLASKLNNPKKSLKECFDYILIEISKKATKEDGVALACGEDEELYALAVHYFDEDDIEVSKKNFSTNADGSADLSRLTIQKQDRSKKQSTDDIDAIVEKKVKAILDKKKKEELEAKKAKKVAKKKQQEDLDKAQLSLFD